MTQALLTPRPKAKGLSKSLPVASRASAQGSSTASFPCFCFPIWVRRIIGARRGFPRGKYGMRAGVCMFGVASRSGSKSV